LPIHSLKSCKDSEFSGNRDLEIDLSAGLKVFQYLTNRLAVKNVSEMTYFMSVGT